MRQFFKTRRLTKPLVCLVLALCAALYAELSLNDTPEHFQYLWAASAQAVPAADSAKTVAPNATLSAARLSMETVREALQGACEPTTLYAVAEGATVSVAEDENVTGATPAVARLEALGDDAFALKRFTLYVGRLIYPDELRDGNRVCMLDEQLAVALFKYAEPLDRRVMVGTQEYRVVGVLRASKRVGDEQEYSLYLPYRAVEKGDVRMNALCIETAPIEGAGGWAAFTSAMNALNVGGTAISLTKERMNAAMPLRLLLCAMGFLIVILLLRWLGRRSAAFYRRTKDRLRGEYAYRLLPWMSGQGLLLALGYALCAFGFAQVFMRLVDPVYTFPEWVPAVLVEPNDIATAFWNVWQSMAKLVEYRSPELIRIRFFREVMAWSCGAAALFAGLLTGRAVREPKEAPVEEKNEET